MKRNSSLIYDLNPVGRGLDELGTVRGKIDDDKTSLSPEEYFKEKKPFAIIKIATAGEKTNYTSEEVQKDRDVLEFLKNKQSAINNAKIDKDGTLKKGQQGYNLRKFNCSSLATQALKIVYGIDDVGESKVKLLFIPVNFKVSTPNGLFFDLQSKENVKIYKNDNTDIDKNGSQKYFDKQAEKQGYGALTPNNRKYGREEKRIERREKREAKKELKSSGGKRKERAKF